MIEEKYKLEVRVGSSILPWIVRRAAFVYTRFQVRKNGHTPYEEHNMTKCQGALLEFGDVVLKREAGVCEQKLAILWDKGVWLGRATDTGDHIVGCPGGVAEARAVKRLATEAERWGRQIFDKMVWLPWATTEEELKLVGDEWYRS